MIYNLLKCLHILAAATTLCSNGYIGIHLHYLVRNTSPTDPTLKAVFQKAGRQAIWLTLPFGFLQATMGFWMISLKGIPLTLPWLWLPMACFLGCAILWCMILYCHLQCTSTLDHGIPTSHIAFKRPFQCALALGLIGFGLILISVYTMSLLNLHWPT